MNLLETSPRDDAPARARIREDLGSTLLVEAGAGSGKTTELVTRVCALVASGAVELREIAAITFTEAAAAELRSRIEAALIEARRAGATGGGEELALSQLDDAAMTTIHGFAQRLLAEHPLEAGLPLRFEVVDEIGVVVATDRRFDQFVDRLFDDPSAHDLIAAAATIGLSPEHLRALFARTNERWDTLSALRPDRFDPSSLLLEARAVRAQAVQLAERGGECADPDDRLLERLGEIGRQAEAFASDADWIDALRWLVDLKVTGSNLGKAPSWPDVEDVRVGVRALDAARNVVYVEVADAVMRELGSRICAEAEAFARERLAAGTLFFHDLLVAARDLLRDHDDVRRLAQDRYRRVLVDEFQDTDPLQLDIVDLLTRDVATGTPLPGRAFFVGDPMQSIYRFRGADLSIYERARAEIAGGRPERLSMNFRSVPGIVEFVNAVFGALGEKAGTTADVGLVAARGSNEGDCPVRVIGGPRDKVSAAQRRQAEAAEVAAAIVDAVSSGWAVVDDDATRPARLGDIAVLVPNRNGLRELEAALGAASIDYELAQSSLVYATPEVRDLIALLRCVEDRGDERDVVAALRTPYLALSDPELARYRTGGGEWRLDANAVEADPVSAAISALRAIRDERAAFGVLGTLDALVARFSVRETLASGPRALVALRRLEFLLERARGFVESGGRSIGDLLSFVGREALLGPRQVDHTPVGDDAVSVLTVHGAKGLEFPIVILAELGGELRDRPIGTVVLGGRDGSLELSTGSGRATSGFSALADDEEEEGRAEAMRLCYVAMTRARDHLVVSLHHKTPSSEPDSLAAFIDHAIADARSCWSSYVPPQLEGPLVSKRHAEPLAAERYLSELARIERRATFLDRQTSLVASSLEEAPLGSDGAAPHDEDEDDDGGIRLRRARAASRIGRAVHATLQHVDLATGARLAEFAELFARAEGCRDDLDVVIRLADAARRVPSVVQASTSPTLRRELPVTLVVDGGVVEGVVDLYFDDDGPVVVDYKTDALRSLTEARTRAERYRLQAGAYASALEAITGRAPSRFVLVFLALPGGAVEVEVEDLPAAMRDARSAAESVLTATEAGGT